MSRAFTKEDAGDFDEPPERHQSSSPNYVTPEGLSALRRAMDELRARAERLGQDDRQALEVRRDLRYYSGRIANAILVEPPKNLAAAEARFGASIVLKRANGSIRRVKIVGQDEAEDGGDKIAWDSALALALMGAKAGDRVVSEEEGALTVVEVRYAAPRG